MDSHDNSACACCRRTFLGRGIAGLGLLGLNALLDPRLFAADSKGVVNPLHHPAKAKRVIFLYQAGGPSHLETFDYKPKLAEMHGQPMPDSLTKGQQIAQLQGKPLNCFGPQYQFRKFGFNGGYTRLYQGIGASNATPIDYSSFFVGMQRWFNMF